MLHIIGDLVNHLQGEPRFLFLMKSLILLRHILRKLPYNCFKELLTETETQWRQETFDMI